MLEWLIALTVANVLLVGLGSILLLLMHATLLEVQTLARSWEATAQPEKATGTPLPGTSWMTTDREVAELEKSMQSDSRQRALAGLARSDRGLIARRG